jgi:hypothetical protein
VPEGRVASLMVRDAALAKRLARRFRDTLGKSDAELPRNRFPAGAMTVLGFGRWTLFGPYASDQWGPHGNGPQRIISR